jgi:DNA-binding XRE family transcriptional regulator
MTLRLGQKIKINKKPHTRRGWIIFEFYFYCFTKENGRSNPQVLTYAKIAFALGVDLREIFLFEPSFNYKAFGEQPATYSPRKHNKWLFHVFDKIP